ncbi:hypothetical protein F5Y13DRAFT_193806 [Hypoxylon sp. FL1857]|nr:hypothetical protein F5Y13DRAFT_193806 [Hypoxylon sp. FL1857]
MPEKREAWRDPKAFRPVPYDRPRPKGPPPFLRSRRSRSLPPPNYRPKPRPEYVDDWLPPLDIEIPGGSHYWKNGVLHCQGVKAAPRWFPRPGYGHEETELKICDARALDNKFPLPFKDRDIWLRGATPDDILARVITDWRRTPILSFRPDTGNVVSRISRNLAAKWGPDVCQAEADIMWLCEGKYGLTHHIPSVQRVLRDPVTGYLIIIMDYIRGGYTLVDIWNRISEERKRTIAVRIAETLKLMQEYTARYPGSAGIRRCRALVHKKYPVPLCMTAAKYDEYLNVLVNGVNSRRPQRFHDNFVRTSEFALANMKLDPSSFVLDKKGAVWVVGWGKGGFYPKEGELAISEHLMPERYSILVKVLLESIPHDQSLRDTLRAIATLIDEDLLEKEPK